jgi:DNA-binding NarL/FixJ family response regulator
MALNFAGVPPVAMRVLIVEDQSRLRESLVVLIDGTAGLSVVGSFGSMEEALAALGSLRPDVALLDLGLPGMSGIDGVRLIRERSPATQALVLTVHDDDDHVFEAICAGASGYLLKDTPPARLVAAIQELGAGGAPMSPSIARAVVGMFRRVAPQRTGDGLSPRELEVLTLLAAGNSYKTAASELSVSIDTVRFHVRHIYDKLHVHSKSEAVMKAWKQGLLR